MIKTKGPSVVAGAKDKRRCGDNLRLAPSRGHHQRPPASRNISPPEVARRCGEVRRLYFFRGRTLFHESVHHYHKYPEDNLKHIRPRARLSFEERRRLHWDESVGAPVMV
jgi:hypothetical protein